MTFERTKDVELIKSILTHPRIYPFISDDFSPSAEDYQVLDPEQMFYVLVKKDDEVLGLWAFVPHNRICWDVHTCLLPSSWGPIAREAAKECAEWIFQNTECKRITTEVPEYNRLALQFALAAGMQPYGTNPESFQKKGKLWNVILLGISKPKVN